MLVSLLVLLALAVMAVVAVVFMVGVLARVVVGLILLPFRIIGWVLWIPFMIVKGIVSAVV
jgi:hypothetical protein